MLVKPKSSPGRRAIWVMRKLIVKHHHIIIISVTIFITRTEGCAARSPREAMKDQARMSIVSFEARVGPVPTLSDDRGFSYERDFSDGSKIKEDFERRPSSE